MPRSLKLTASTKPVDRLIHSVRGSRVILDRDLAALYQVQTFNLNKAVKRNIGRFPEDFMFRLTKEEASNLTFQGGMSSWGGRRTQPYAFTEHGVAMLSAILHSRRAVETSVMVVRAFVRMRELLAANKDLAERVEKLERTHERAGSVIEMLVEDIDRLANEVKQMQTLPSAPKRKIGFSA